MKRTLGIIGLALTIGVGATACGTDLAAKPEPEVTYSKPTTTTSAYSLSVQGFLISARNRFPYETDDKLIWLGQQSCATIIAYGSLTKTMIAIAENPAWTREMARDAGYLFGISIPVFCPQFKAEAQRLVEG